MYSATSSSITSLVNSNIKLPRFQRKQTWSEKRRFELCISLFKNYPMGTIVIKKDIVNGNPVNWLLDGRQRWDTFLEMQNPENIYRWAKDSLKLVNSDSPEQIRSKFRAKTNEFIENDENEDDSEDETNNDENSPNDIDEINFETDAPSDDPYPSDFGESVSGLDGLEFIICAVHPLRGKSSSFTKPFLIRNYKPSYVKLDDKGRPYVDSSKLIKWIPECDSVDDLTVESVYEWYDNPTEDVKKHIQDNIDEIRRSVRVLKIIKDQMANSNIQQIELDNSCSVADSRKIFELINTGGVSLTEPEILSAKPSWNIPIKNTSDLVQKNVDDLYKSMLIDYEGIVKWDVAATLTDRLNKSSRFIIGQFKPFTDPDIKSTFDKKITTGFKILSAYYLGSITKNDMDRVSKLNDIDWSSQKVENELNDVADVIVKDYPFKILYAYKITMSDMLSNTIAMCFFILISRKWNDLKKPKPHSGNFRSFTLHTRILFDRFVYEYVSDTWKGSSDSRLSNYLGDNYSTIFECVDDNAWKILIEDLFSKNQISGQQASRNALNALTFYFSMIRGKEIQLIDDETIQIDHIIPEAKFTQFHDSLYKNSLWNLALLPSSLNDEKKDKAISELNENSKKKVCELEDIDVEKVDCINGPADIDNLKEIRKGIVQEIIDRRLDFVKGMGRWRLD